MLDRLKLLFRKLLLSNASPEELSSALALGVFITFTPTVGFHTWIALGLATLLKKNKIATLLGAHLNNPLTLIPVFYFNFQLGEWILGESQKITMSRDLLFHPFSMGTQLLVPLWVGSLIVAIGSALLAYYLSRLLFRIFKNELHHYREKHRHAP